MRRVPDAEDASHLRGDAAGGRAARGGRCVVSRPLSAQDGSWEVPRCAGPLSRREEPPQTPFLRHPCLSIAILGAGPGMPITALGTTSCFGALTLGCGTFRC